MGMRSVPTEGIGFHRNNLDAALVQVGHDVLCMSKPQCRPMSAMFRTSVVSVYAFLCLLPFALYEARQYDFGAITLPSLLCIGYYGIFVSFLSYVFWFKGITAVPAGIAACFTAFVPLSSVFLSWLILHESIPMLHWVGLLFVLAGIGISCGHGNFLRRRRYDLRDWQ